MILIFDSTDEREVKIILAESESVFLERSSENQQKQAEALLVLLAKTLATILNVPPTRLIGQNPLFQKLHVSSE